VIHRFNPTVGPLLLAGLVSCNSGHGKSTASDPQSAPSAESASTSNSGAAPAATATAATSGKGLATFGAERPAIRVLEAGEAPRRTLAYQPKAVSRNVTLALAMPVPGGSGGEMTHRFELSWSSTAAAPSRYAFAVSKAHMAAPGSPSHPTMQSRFEQVAGVATAAASDHLIFARTQGSPTTPSVPMFLHLLSVPLPSEPVGQGARWQLSEPVTKPGMTGEATRTLHLRVLSEVGATIGIERQSTWQPRPAKAGVTGTSAFEAEAELRFDDVLPQSAKGTFRQSTKLPLPGGGDEPPIETTIGVTLGPGSG